jgi:homoserine O-succinyltransferase/O-acetyltransferase
MNSVKIAVLDLYEGETNEGMRCIRELIEQFRGQHHANLEFQVFDVRLKKEIPDLSFDAYISSGGPGSPLESDGSDWEENFFGLMNDIKAYNSQNPFDRKHVFLICHSFQIFCRKYGYAMVNRRKSPAFGVMQVNKTKDGRNEPLFRGLPDPFFAVDSRQFQITKPKEEKIWSGGGHILCIEKERPHIALERAVMAIRFDEAFIGAQFHPEADSDGMYRHMILDERKKEVIDRYGEKKYHQMLQYLNEPDKIKLTYRTVIPGFLKMALQPKMNPVVL